MTIPTHERLEVYRLARRQNQLIAALLEGLSTTGFAHLVDQLRRAAISVAANIAEGAGEYSPKEKARFYRMARRSNNECIALLDSLCDYGLARHGQMRELRECQSSIAALLVTMLRNLDQRT